MTTTPKTISIRPEFVSLCELWHDGQSSMMYAVSSTGGVSLGSQRPSGCDTDEKWLLQLWENLADEVSTCRSIIEKSHRKYGLEEMREFEQWCDGAVEELATAYGLEDWDGE